MTREIFFWRQGLCALRGLAQGTVNGANLSQWERRKMARGLGFVCSPLGMAPGERSTGQLFTRNPYFEQ